MTEDGLIQAALEEPVAEDTQRDRQLERRLIAQLQGGNAAAASVLADFYESRGLRARADLCRWIHERDFVPFVPRPRPAP